MDEALCTWTGCCKVYVDKKIQVLSGKPYASALHQMADQRAAVLCLSLPSRRFVGKAQDSCPWTPGCYFLLVLGYVSVRS